MFHCYPFLKTNHVACMEQASHTSTPTKGDTPISIVKITANGADTHTEMHAAQLIRVYRFSWPDKARLIFCIKLNGPFSTVINRQMRVTAKTIKA